MAAAEWPGMKREKTAADKGRETSERKPRTKAGGRGAKRGAAIPAAALARCLESLRSHCAASAVGGEAVWQRKRARSRSRAATLSSGGEEAPRAAPARKAKVEATDDDDPVRHKRSTLANKRAKAPQLIKRASSAASSRLQQVRLVGAAVL